MVDAKLDPSYLDHDTDVLRELIRRGRESGPARPMDWDEFLREANEDLEKLQDMK